MFYENTFSDTLRFGDVLKNVFIYPFSYDSVDNLNKIDVNIKKVKFCVVLTPCCSMNKTKILVSPLTKLSKKFTQNEYFRDDFTNVNREMEPKKSVSKNAWEHMGENDRAKLIGRGFSYAFLNLFVYAENDFFKEEEYNDKTLGEVKSRCLMIDFGNIFQVNCDEITNSSQYPKDLKILELSADTRKELREKLSDFYSRPTTEDLAKL